MPRRTPAALRHPARVLGVVVPLGVLLWFAQFSLGEELPTWQPLLDLGLGAGAIALVPLRRRRPFLVAALAVAATAGSGMAYPAAVAAFLTLVITRRWPAIGAVSAIGVGSALLAELVQPTAEEGLPLWAVPLAALGHFGLLVGIGVLVGSRRDLAAARVEQTRAEERTRIAREMHDVLAHRVSLVALHAGAMSYRTDLDAAALRSSARLIHDNAQLALGELRDVLGVLRDPTAAAAPEPPQPTLDDLPELLAEARAAGPVQLRDGRPAGAAVSATAGRTAYRIVQEGLTNARKHAPGAPVQVALAGAPGGSLRVEVSNPARVPTVPALPGAQLGLVGLGERVTSLGGRLRHGLGADGEHRLEAELPWPR